MWTPNFHSVKINFVHLSSLTDMSKPKLSADIARQLRKFHEVEIPGSRELQLWNDMTKFLEKASGLKFDDIEKQRRYETISFEEVRDAVSELKDLTAILNAPVVFAHNDLLSGNLMRNEDEGRNMSIHVNCEIWYQNYCTAILVLKFED
ncbi:hypothetical protein IFM89_027332 [Coptis chinensis]|uniref:ethanolamine kinase n=1 Tax=Coptis chinensis TaxID=261450 RepID=A0A835HFR9_9MAGN|nr:hypothetical protein IFM89_027332 [Coptis chinensis]